MLIQTHCNIDLQREDGCTALFIATQNGHAGVTNQLIEAHCNINIPNVHGSTAVHAAERMGHTTIATLIRNTRQKIAESVVRQAEEERPGLVALLAAVPQEDWCRTWPACRTIMFRRTSKRIKEQVDKMHLPAVVQRCRDDVNHINSTCPSLIEKLEIVMNKLPLMTSWCRITTLEVGGLRDFPLYKTPETFAGMLEGVLGQSAGSLTHLDLDSNSLGSDGVRRLAGVLAQCTELRYLRLSSNDLARAGAVALAGALAHCRALNHLDLRDNEIGPAGAESLPGVLGQCAALARRNLCDNDIGDVGTKRLAGVLAQFTALSHLHLHCNDIGPGGAGKLARVLAQCTALTHLDLSDNSIGPGGAGMIAFLFKKKRAQITGTKSVRGDALSGSKN